MPRTTWRCCRHCGRCAFSWPWTKRAFGRRCRERAPLPALAIRRQSWPLPHLYVHASSWSKTSFPPFLQELDPCGAGQRRYISPDLLRFEHGDEAALVFTPSDGGNVPSLGVLAFNLTAAAACDAAGSHLHLPKTRILFLGSNHYYHCSPTVDLDILVCDGALGVGGSCGRLLAFDPSGVPGFAPCDVAVLADLLSATAAQVSGRGSPGTGFPLCVAV